MSIILANGCFDVLHIGHVEHLQEARKMGDSLIVSLTRDHAVNKGPGRPLYTWDDRAAVLMALKCVTAILPCDSSLEAIRLVRPAIFVKGIDYANGHPDMVAVEAACREVGAELRFTSAPKRSVTEVIKRTLELA